MLANFREFEKAEEHFKVLIIANGQDEHVTGWLAQLYVAWAEQLRIEVNALEAYLDSLGAEALEQTNGDAACIRDLVDQRRRQMIRVLDNAATLGESLIQHRYDDYLCHRVMADYYRVQKQRKLMDKELAEVERLRPESNGLKFIRGAALAQFDGDYDSAIIYYYKALAEEPMFVKSLYFVGLAYHECGRIYDAKRTMHQVLEKSPGHPGARIYLDPKGYIADLVTEAGLDSLEELELKLPEH